jgi:hypothetical protein
MNIEVILKDMTRIYPSYSPEHRKGVIEFYANLFESGEIAGWKII